jgi:hypothetical protein
MVIQYLREENGILKARLRHRRVRFADDERRRLAALGRLWVVASGASCDACHAGHDSPPASYPTWGYTRIQDALKNLGHRVARSTVATILKQHGMPPSDKRPTSWQALLRTHWGALVAADFFTTEV